jgi:hypothetical protein
MRKHNTDNAFAVHRDELLPNSGIHRSSIHTTAFDGQQD